MFAGNDIISDYIHINRLSRHFQPIQDEGVESSTHTKWEPPTLEHSIAPDDGDDQSSAQSQSVPPPLLSQPTPSVFCYSNRNR